MGAETMLHGECLCRRVGYETPDAFEYAMICHCSNCRRAAGSAFRPFAGIKADRLAITRGRELTMRYGDECNHDVHCGACGSLLYSLVRDAAYVHVTLGTLIDAPSIRPSAHIFVGSKAPWDRICDGLPEFAEFPTR